MLMVLLFSMASCEMQSDETLPDEKQMYDLFPLKVGNEFFYSYARVNKLSLLDSEIEKGSMRWKVISNSEYVPPDSLYRYKRSFSMDISGDLDYYTLQQLRYNRVFEQSNPAETDSAYQLESDTIYFGITENVSTREISFHLTFTIFFLR